MRNLGFTDPQLTGPWQSFMDIPTNADEGIKELDVEDLNPYQSTGRWLVET